MTHYLITFPGAAMDVPADEMAAVGDTSRAVIQEAKDAGVYVFAGGLDEGVGPVLMAVDGTAVEGSYYPQTGGLTGGFTILDLPSAEAAQEWGAKIAAACRCSQEVRPFMYDPMS